MIVDFVSIKEKLNQGLDILLREEVKKRTPFLGMVGKFLIHEGNKSSYETIEHEKKNLEFKKAESSFMVTREEMNKMTFKDIIQKIQTLAEDMAGQMERGTFQTLLEEIEKAGQNIKGNPPFSPEAFLQGLKMIEIDFDEDSRDKPRLPTIIMHPSQFAKVKEQEAKMTEEEKMDFDKKMKQILDKKYEEYIVRESKRKLVD